MSRIRQVLEARLHKAVREQYEQCCGQAVSQRIGRDEPLEAPFTLGEILDTPAGRKLIACAVAVGADGEATGDGSGDCMMGRGIERPWERILPLTAERGNPTTSCPDGACGVMPAPQADPEAVPGRFLYK